MKKRVKEHGDSNAPPPALDECIAQIKSIVTEIAGRKDAMPREAVEFYAAEAFSIVEKLRHPDGLITPRCQHFKSISLDVRESTV
jgi:hypothetical protein